MSATISPECPDFVFHRSDESDAKCKTNTGSIHLLVVRLMTSVNRFGEDLLPETAGDGDQGVSRFQKEATGLLFSLGIPVTEIERLV
jgi:hypothetical protein